MLQEIFFDIMQIWKLAALQIIISVLMLLDTLASFLCSDVFCYYYCGLLLRYMLSAIAWKLTSNSIRSIIYPEKN